MALEWKIQTGKGARTDRKVDKVDRSWLSRGQGSRLTRFEVKNAVITARERMSASRQANEDIRVDCLHLRHGCFVVVGSFVVGGVTTDCEDPKAIRDVVGGLIV